MNIARFTLALLLGAASATATAHYPWLMLYSYMPEVDQPWSFGVGWGHRFPGDGAVSSERLVSAVLVGSQGQHPIAFTDKAERLAVAPVRLQGVVMLAGVLRSDYYSRTSQGGRRGSKRDFPDARRCSYSNSTVKALLGADPDVGAAGAALGYVFEVLPEAGPGSLAAGGTFPVRVLFHGKPWQGKVNAIYADYEKRDGEADYPVQVMTDADGRVEIPLDRNGLWMLRVSTSEPYSQADVCDTINYNATLTFSVR